MSDLLRELDEEVAKERSEAFLEKWGLPIGIFLAVLVVGLFLYFNWQSRSANNALARADTFEQAVSLTASDPATATVLFDEISAREDGFAELASFKAPDALWNAGDSQGALNGWRDYANNSTHNENLRNSARLRLAYFGMGVLEGAEITREIEILATNAAYEPTAALLRAVHEMVYADTAAGRQALLAIAADDAQDPVVTRAAAAMLNFAGAL